MAFLTSTELPTTQFLPITALPRMKAQWRISAPWSMIVGPVMEAVGATMASRAIHTSLPARSYSSSLSDWPSLTTKAPISGSTSQG